MCAGDAEDDRQLMGSSSSAPNVYVCKVSFRAPGLPFSILPLVYPHIRLL